ncbi:SDR family NAD(P)-dependent oxidoreductase [Rubrolithibacter danxiaensis]|uniref:SDR family NAD(P)-dependent oxidoreductase n=1 Tax=Rubrolithibacter danxiaensis TaxID=3390805 RepID=UPI003BF8488C
MRFQNKVCLVTGGSSGIGLATSLRFAAEGGKIVIIARNEQEGNEAVEQIKKTNGEAIFVKTDIAEPDQIKHCVETVLQKYGRIDVLVNNAAMMTFKRIVDLELEEWDKVMAVNLRSIFVFCKLCLPHMKNGAVVNISSVHGHQTTPNVLPYAASKGGIEAFTRGLSIEYKPEQARFNAVAPGAVDTPMLWSNPNVKNGTEKIEGAIGKPEELAAAICFLASEEASYINGTTLVVDGGRLDIL